MPEQFISIEVFCRHEQVDSSFVHSLHERGLIEIVVQREEQYITSDQLPRLERLARMHYDLDINLEGIEAISHLLERVERMQHDLRALQERLHLYEGER
jgi:hypothetical protein